MGSPSKSLGNILFRGFPRLQRRQLLMDAELCAHISWSVLIFTLLITLTQYSPNGCGGEGGGEQCARKHRSWRRQGLVCLGWWVQGSGLSEGPLFNPLLRFSFFKSPCGDDWIECSSFKAIKVPHEPRRCRISHRSHCCDTFTPALSLSRIYHRNMIAILHTCANLSRQIKCYNIIKRR